VVHPNPHPRTEALQRNVFNVMFSFQRLCCICSHTIFGTLIRKNADKSHCNVCKSINKFRKEGALLPKSPQGDLSTGTTSVHQSLSGQAPVYLADDSRLVSETGRRAQRSANVTTLTVLQTQNSYGDRSLCCLPPTPVEQPATVSAT